jgi:hypothetical protein
LLPGEKLFLSIGLKPTEIYKNHFHIIINYSRDGNQCLKEIECLAESSVGEIVNLSIPNDTISYQDINNISIPLEGWIDDPTYEVGTLDLYGTLHFDRRMLNIDEITNGKIISMISVDSLTSIKFECQNVTLSSEKKIITKLTGTANTDKINFTDIKLSSILISPTSKVDTSIILDGSLYISPGTSVPEKRHDLNSVISPNPANSIINVSFELPEASKVGISLTDLLGRQSNQLYDQFANKGINNLSFDISSIPSGLFILKINSSDKSEFIKIIKY